MKKFRLCILSYAAFLFLFGFISCKPSVVNTQETVYKYTDPEVTSISVFRKPDILVYELGDKLDLGGIIVTAKYNNGMTSVITDYIAVPANGTELKQARKTDVSITYKSFSSSFSVDVYEQLPGKEAVLKDITILQKPSKLLYKTGEGLDLTDLIVTGTYSDGKTTIIPDYTTIPEAGTVFENNGPEEITVLYGDFSETFSVIVSEQVISEDIYLKSISIFQKPLKTSYEKGDSFSSYGLIVIGNYSNDTISLIKDYEIDFPEGGELNEVGIKTIAVSKGSIVVNFDIQVFSKIIYEDIGGINVNIAPYSDITITKDTVENGVKLSASSGLTSYSWRINSVEVGNENTFIVNTNDLVPGNYEIFLIGKDTSGNYRSATIYIKVNE